MVCCLCKCPFSDDGLPIAQLDNDQWTHWCREHLGVEPNHFDEESSWICQFCISDARSLSKTDSSTSKNKKKCWWNFQSKEEYSYFTDHGIRRCYVLSEKVSDEDVARMCRLHIHPCFYCGLKLPTLGEIRIHVKEKHPDLNFTCSFLKCGMYFWTEADRSHHMTEVHRAINISCNFCNMTFTRNINLREHIDQAHLTESALCCPERNCVTFAKSTSELAFHVKIFHNKCKTKSILNCCNCNFTTSSKRQLKIHLLSNHLSKPMDCSLCSKQFLTAIDMQNHHEEKHQKVIYVVCLHCRKDVQQNRIQLHSKKSLCSKCNSKLPCRGLFFRHSLSCRAKKRNCATGRKKYIFEQNLSMTFPVQKKARASIPRHKKIASNDDKKRRSLDYTVGKAKSMDRNLFFGIGDIHKIQQIVCALCTKVLNSKLSMLNHLLRLHAIGIGLFTCKKCKTPFIKTYEFKRHKIYCSKRKSTVKHNLACFSKKTVTRTIVASTRNEDISNMPSMKIKSSSGCGKVKKLFNVKCPFCELISSKSRMLYHLVVMHGIGQGLFDCINCKVSFPCSADYKRHLRGCKPMCFGPVDSKSKVIALTSSSTISRIERNKSAPNVVINSSDEVVKNNSSTLQSFKKCKLRAFECAHCSKTFSKKISMKYHLLKVHQIGGKRIVQDNYQSLSNDLPVKNCVRTRLQIDEIVSKKDTCQTNQEELQSKMYPLEEWVHIFTDGSTDNNNTGYGIYCIFFEESHPSETELGTLDAKVKAIVKAAEKIAETANFPLRKNKFVIFSDSEAAIRKATQLSAKADKEDKLSMTFKQTLVSIGMQKKLLHVQWIPSDCKLLGKQKAEALAKIGAMKCLNLCRN